MEREAQPKAFSSTAIDVVGDRDSDDGRVWGCVSVYGGGKVVTGISLLLGVGLFALPAGILASGFAEDLARSKQDERRRACQHCGKEIAGE